MTHEHVPDYWWEDPQDFLVDDDQHPQEAPQLSMEEIPSMPLEQETGFPMRYLGMLNRYRESLA